MEGTNAIDGAIAVPLDSETPKESDFLEHHGALSTSAMLEHTVPPAVQAFVDHEPAVLHASDDPSVLRERVLKYQKVTAKLKEMVALRDAELKARSAELAALQPFAAQLASSLLGSSSQDRGGFIATAKIIIGSTRATAVESSSVSGDAGAEAATPVSVPWCCISSRAGDRQEWHPIEVIVAQNPGFASTLQALEPHVPPQEHASLKSRLLGERA